MQLYIEMSHFQGYSGFLSPLGLRCILLFPWVTLVLGLAPSPPNPAINFPSQFLTPINTSSPVSGSSSSFLPSLNLSKIDHDIQIFNVTDEVPLCLSTRFGFIENPASCLLAWTSIPTDSQIKTTYGAREIGVFEMPMPYRFLSRESHFRISSSHSLQYWGLQKHWYQNPSGWYLRHWHRPKENFCMGWCL